MVERPLAFGSEESTVTCPECFHSKQEGEVCPFCGYDDSKLRASFTLPHRTILADRYLVGRVLAPLDGVSISYLCTDKQTGDSVVLEEFFPRMFVGRGADLTSVLPHSDHDRKSFNAALECFFEEAEQFTRIDHPNLFSLLDQFRENGTGYVVFPYQRGRLLEDELAEVGRVDPNVALPVVGELFSGLNELHGQNVIHGALSPNCVILKVGEDGEVHPLLLNALSTRAILLTSQKTAPTVLQSGYAPFEQYHAFGNSGPWTDIYSGFAILYRMLTGVTPPDALSRLVHDQLLPPSHLGIGLRRELENLLMHGLSPRPEDRPQSIEVFEHLLTPFTSPGQSSSRTEDGISRYRHSPVYTPPDRNVPPVPYDIPYDVRGTRKSSYVFAGILLIFIAVAGWLFFSNRSIDPASELNVLDQFPLETARISSPPPASQTPAARSFEALPEPDVLRDPIDSRLASIEEPAPTGLVVLDSVDVAPAPLGGASWLESIRYPEEAGTNTSGSVVVQFVVDREGVVSYPLVTRSLGRAFDDEAIRVVTNTRFRPAMRNGRPVTVRVSMPVPFNRPAPAVVEAPRPAVSPLAQVRRDLATAESEKNRGAYDAAEQTLQRALARLNGLGATVSSSEVADLRGRIGALRAENRQACEVEAQILQKRGETPPVCP
jgi:TonB family protein